MRLPRPIPTVLLGIAGLPILVCVVMFTNAVPRRLHSTAPITNEDWEILSNSALHRPHIRVAASPFGHQIRKASDDDFRRLLKLLMPFDATTESHGEEYDYELVYQGGKDPTQISIVVDHDDLRFWINGQSIVYRTKRPNKQFSRCYLKAPGDQKGAAGTANGFITSAETGSSY